MPRDEEFRAKEKKFHKMTRDGLVERGAASGEETRISGREQDFDLRQARDSPDSLEDLSAKARHTRQQKQKDGDNPQAEPVENGEASPLEDSQPQAHEDAPQEEPREKPGSRRSRHQQKFSESSSASEAAAEQPRTSKLQFAAFSWRFPFQAIPSRTADGSSFLQLPMKGCIPGEGSVEEDQG